MRLRSLDREMLNHERRVRHLEATLERAREAKDAEMEVLARRLLHAEHSRHEEKSRRLAGD